MLIMITKKEYEHLKESLLHIVDSKYGGYSDTCEAVKALVELERLYQQQTRKDKE